MVLVGCRAARPRDQIISSQRVQLVGLTTMNRISLRSSTDSINPCRTVHWSSATPLPRRSAVLLGISAISSFATNANPAPASGTHRIGYLYGRSKPAPGVRDPFLEAFLFGLRELGYVEG